MASHPVVGIYSSMARARLAQEALIEEGMPEGRISISIDMSHDAIAAEAPGQSYVNQPSDRREGGWFGSRRRAEGRSEPAPGLLDAAESGTCAVTADARSPEEADRVHEVMAALRPLQIKVPVT
jgi:hypothetical protein